MIGPSLLRWYSDIDWNDSLVLADLYEEQGNNLCEVIRDCHHLDSIYNKKKIRTLSRVSWIDGEIITGFKILTKDAVPFRFFIKNADVRSIIMQYGLMWETYYFSLRKLIKKLDANEYVRRKHESRQSVCELTNRARERMLAGDDVRRGSIGILLDGDGNVPNKRPIV